jgi:hypothetical protein
MLEKMEAAARNLDPKQATDLALLVELEARWENLRKTPAQASDVKSESYDLRGIQKAYEDFHSKLVAYNKSYTPHHVPERLLNTPVRLAAWCRSMKQLYLWVETYPQMQCPVHLLQKAYRWADRLSCRLNKSRVTRSTAPGTIHTVIQDLETLGRWCDGLEHAAPSAGGSSMTGQKFAQD